MSGTDEMEVSSTACFQPTEGWLLQLQEACNRSNVRLKGHNHLLDTIHATAQSQPEVSPDLATDTVIGLCTLTKIRPSFCASSTRPPLVDKNQLSYRSTCLVAFLVFSEGEYFLCNAKNVVSAQLSASVTQRLGHVDAILCMIYNFKWISTGPVNSADPTGSNTKDGTDMMDNYVEIDHIIPAKSSRPLPISISQVDSQHASQHAGEQVQSTVIQCSQDTLCLANGMRVLVLDSTFSIRVRVGHEVKVSYTEDVLYEGARWILCSNLKAIEICSFSHLSTTTTRLCSSRFLPRLCKGFDLLRLADCVWVHEQLATLLRSLHSIPRKYIRSLLTAMLAESKSQTDTSHSIGQSPFMLKTLFDFDNHSRRMMSVVQKALESPTRQNYVGRSWLYTTHLKEEFNSPLVVRLTTYASSGCLRVSDSTGHFPALVVSPDNSASRNSPVLHRDCLQKASEPASLPSVNFDIQDFEHVPSEPVTFEPVTSEPVRSKPVTSEPVPSKPVTFDPVHPECLVSENRTSESARSQFQTGSRQFLPDSANSNPHTPKAVVDAVTWTPLTFDLNAASSMKLSTECATSPSLDPDLLGSWVKVEDYTLVLEYLIDGSGRSPTVSLIAKYFILKIKDIRKLLSPSGALKTPTRSAGTHFEGVRKHKNSECHDSFDASAPPKVVSTCAMSGAAVHNSGSIETMEVNAAPADKNQTGLNCQGRAYGRNKHENGADTKRSDTVRLSRRSSQICGRAGTSKTGKTGSCEAHSGKSSLVGSVLKPVGGNSVAKRSKSLKDTEKGIVSLLDPNRLAIRKGMSVYCSSKTFQQQSSLCGSTCENCFEMCGLAVHRITNTRDSSSSLFSGTTPLTGKGRNQRHRQGDSLPNRVLVRFHGNAARLYPFIQAGKSYHMKGMRRIGKSPEGRWCYEFEYVHNIKLIAPESVEFGAGDLPEMSNDLTSVSKAKLASPSILSVIGVVRSRKDSWLPRCVKNNTLRYRCVTFSLELEDCTGPIPRDESCAPCLSITAYLGVSLNRPKTTGAIPDASTAKVPTGPGTLLGVLPGSVIVLRNVQLCISTNPSDPTDPFLLVHPPGVGGSTVEVISSSCQSRPFCRDWVSGSPPVRRSVWSLYQSPTMKPFCTHARLSQTVSLRLTAACTVCSKEFVCGRCSDMQCFSGRSSSSGSSPWKVNAVYKCLLQDGSCEFFASVYDDNIACVLNLTTHHWERIKERVSKGYPIEISPKSIPAGGPDHGFHRLLQAICQRAKMAAPKRMTMKATSRNLEALTTWNPKEGYEYNVNLSLDRQRGLYAKVKVRKPFSFDVRVEAVEPVVASMYVGA